MTSDTAQLDRLQTTLDAAVLDPQGWAAVCDRLAEFLGGVGSSIAPEVPMDNRTGQLVHSPALGEFLDAMFREGWNLKSYRRRAIPIIKERGYATDAEIADETVMRREPFYADFLASQKLGAFIGLRVPAGGEVFIGAVQRSVKAPLPDEALFGRVRLALPMLAAAARASVALGSIRMQTWQELAAEASQPMFVLDYLGRILDRNAETETVIGRAATINGRHLELVNPRANIQFQELIDAACRSDGPQRLPRPVFVEMPGQGVAMFEAVRLPVSVRAFHNAAAAIVVVRPVSSGHLGLPALLRRHSALTDAEVKVAVALFEGQSLGEFAERNGLTIGTARQQVKSVFRKTGTNRQAELVTLLRRLGEGDAS